MAASPLVSVIIPVFNGENFVKEAIDSVLAQTYQPIEILVIDDGSKDNTAEILYSFDKRIRIFQKKNGGVASALNHGIREAEGEFIAWLSHDDVFLPEKINKQVEFLDIYQQFCACYSNFEIINASGQHINNYIAKWYPAKELPRRFLHDMHINGSTTLIRKEFLVKAGFFNEKLWHTQDIDMWIRLAQIGEIGHVNEILIQSRSHLQQGSLNIDRQISEEQAFFQKLWDIRGPSFFFPELEKILNENKKIAIGSKIFGDEVFIGRKWVRFAFLQYQISYKLIPSLGTRFKIFKCRIYIFLFGDEQEVLKYIKQAKLLLGFGMQQRSRELSKQMFEKHILRLDAWIIWLKSYIPESIYVCIRKIIKGR